MTIRFPNRVGESGIYTDGTPPAITLSGSALMRLRTFSAAATGGAIAANDTIGLSVEHAANPNIWQVWTATWTGTGLLAVTVEDQSGVLVDGDSVEVRAVVTAATLDAAYAPTPAIPSVLDGPDWWEEDTAASGGISNATWIAEEGHYETDGGFVLIPATTGANAGWGTGFNPREISAEVYIPMDSYPYDTYLKLLANDSAAVGSSPSPRDEGTWVTLTITADQGLSGATDMVNLILSEMPTGSEPGLLRNIRVVGE